MTMTTKASESSQLVKKIYIVAGEESGDMLGADIMASIQNLAKDMKYKLEFYGVGGQNMQAKGFSSLFPMQELSLMGILEIIPHIGNIFSRLLQTIDDVKKIQPDVIVTIDSPGFNFKLAKKISQYNIPIVHIVAPTVWAWRPKRAAKIAKYLNHLLVLFAFEPEYFTKYGLKTTFIGHPLVDKKPWNISSENFRKKYKISSRKSILCFLPGSRKAEIKMHLNIFLDTLEVLKAKYNNIEVVIPTTKSLQLMVENILNQRNVSAFVITDNTEKYAAMRASTAALVVSGTVTLELGLMAVPMVVVYKVNKLTAYIIEKLLITKHISLANILLNKAVVTELLQEAFNVDNCAAELHQLLKKDSSYNSYQKKELQKLRSVVKNSQGSASLLAAQEILEYLK